MKNTCTHASDEAIIALFFERNEAAIQRTHEKYGGYLYTVAFNLLRDTQDCEECRNDTYLRAWNTIPPERPTKLQAYLTKLIRAISVDRYRERTRQKRVPSELTISLEELAEALPAPENCDELAECLSKFLTGLSKRSRLIFVSRYYCADPTDRIAEMLGVTPSAVYKELRKIKKALREHLEKEGYSI